MTESAIKNSPLVSVIINCFNGEKYLHEAIDSVLSQSYTNWEIIFWDNRSSDSSAEITKSYKEQRIKYYYAPRHTKLYEARNLAIAQANGELFAFLDCDDFWYEDKLIKQVELFKDNEVGFAYTNLHLKNENTGSLKKCFKKLESGYVFEKLIRKYNVSFSTVIISKTFWLKIIQRVWKKIFKKRIEWQKKSTHPFALRYREVNGRSMYGHAPTIRGMLSHL